MNLEHGDVVEDDTVKDGFKLVCCCPQHPTPKLLISRTWDAHDKAWGEALNAQRLKQQSPAAAKVRTN